MEKEFILNLAITLFVTGILALKFFSVIMSTEYFKSRRL